MVATAAKSKQRKLEKEASRKRAEADAAMGAIRRAKKLAAEEDAAFASAYTRVTRSATTTSAAAFTTPASSTSAAAAAAAAPAAAAPAAAPAAGEGKAEPAGIFDPEQEPNAATATKKEEKKRKGNAKKGKQQQQQQRSQAPKVDPRNGVMCEFYSLLTCERGVSCPYKHASSNAASYSSEYETAEEDAEVDPRVPCKGKKCAFFGTESSSGYCSVCYKTYSAEIERHRAKEEEARSQFAKARDIARRQAEMDEVQRQRREMEAAKRERAAEAASQAAADLARAEEARVRSWIKSKMAGADVVQPDSVRGHNVQHRSSAANDAAALVEQAEQRLIERAAKVEQQLYQQQLKNAEKDRAAAATAAAAAAAAVAVKDAVPSWGQPLPVSALLRSAGVIDASFGMAAHDVGSRGGGSASAKSRFANPSFGDSDSDSSLSSDTSSSSDSEWEASAGPIERARKMGMLSQSALLPPPTRLKAPPHNRQKPNWQQQQQQQQPPPQQQQRQPQQQRPTANVAVAATRIGTDIPRRRGGAGGNEENTKQQQKQKAPQEHQRQPSAASSSRGRGTRGGSGSAAAPSGCFDDAAKLKAALALKTFATQRHGSFPLCDLGKPSSAGSQLLNFYEQFSQHKSLIQAVKVQPLCAAFPQHIRFERSSMQVFAVQSSGPVNMDGEGQKGTKHAARLRAADTKRARGEKIKTKKKAEMQKQIEQKAAAVAAAAKIKKEEEALADAMLAEFTAEMEANDSEIADDILAMFQDDGKKSSFDDDAAERLAEDLALATIKPKQTIPCSFFLSDAGCFLGKACKFIHPPPLEVH